MKNVMRNRLVAAMALAAMVSSAWAEPSGEVSDWMRRAGGAVVGGVVGNQVGSGKGRTLATATGAVIGSVVASNCKATAGTAVGGVIGGLLGAQAGSGNGKNAMAAVGATIGAWLGTDCSPVVSATKPVPLPGPGFRFNGLDMTPVTGFPLDAFQGVPPILTTDDLTAAREVSMRLAEGAKDSYRAGDAETAMLKMYWAKRIGLAAVAVSSSSLSAVSSISTGKNGKFGPSVTATIPANSLVILPAFDQGTGGSGNAVASLMDTQRFAGQDWSQSFQVADIGASGLFGSMERVLKNVVPGSALPSNNAQKNVVPNLSADLLTIREGQPLRLPNGVFLLKSRGNLTAYNPGNAAASLPLEALDFLPRTPTPSAARQSAAELMHGMYGNMTRWTFTEYQKKTMVFWNRFEAPNRIVDNDHGGAVVAYLDATGNVTPQRFDGEQAYREDSAFKRAADLLDAVDKAPAIVGFIRQCRSELLGNFGKIDGQYADRTISTCFKGSYNNGNPVQVATRTFWIGESGKIVQTLESMVADQQIVATMKNALLAGKTTSDVLSAAGLPLGNVDSALQCFGQDSLSQIMAVEGKRMWDAKGGNLGAIGTGYSRARLAGWQAEPAEWGMDRVANCIGAIPLAGNAVSVGRKVAGLGKEVLGSLPAVDRMESLFKAFDTPTSFSKYVAGTKAVEELVPGNQMAAGFVKAIYDGLMTGQNLVQVGNDIAEIRGSTLVSGE